MIPEPEISTIRELDSVAAKQIKWLWPHTPIAEIKTDKLILKILKKGDVYVDYVVPIEIRAMTEVELKAIYGTHFFQVFSSLTQPSVFYQVYFSDGKTAIRYCSALTFLSSFKLQKD
jgi:hypothetical protein